MCFAIINVCKCTVYSNSGCIAKLNAWNILHSSSEMLRNKGIIINMMQYFLKKNSGMIYYWSKLL